MMRINASTLLVKLRSFKKRTLTMTVQAFQNKAQDFKQQEDVPDTPANWNSAKPFDSMPGPKPYPILGNTPRFLWGEFKGKDFAQINKMIFDQYGKIAVLKGIPGLATQVILYDPEDMEMMFRSEGMWPVREIMPSIAYYRKNIRHDIFHDAPGILTVHGDEWHKTRRAVNPIFMQPKNILHYVQGLDDVSKDMVKVIKNLSQNDSKNEMPEDFKLSIQNWALESIALVALDKRFGCLSDDPKPETRKLIDAICRIFPSLLHIDYEPQGYLYKKFNMKPFRKFVEDMDTVTFIAKKYIDEATEKIRTNTEVQSFGEKSILEKLLETNSKIAVTMTLDMIMAGVDTTTTAAGAVLYYLARNENIQTKLRDELVNLLPREEMPITNEVLAQTPYLKAVIKESMRLAPVTLGTMRRTPRKVVIGGYQIPKGIDVAAIHQLVSHSEKYYKRPMEFIPERWLRSNKDEEISHKNVHAFVTLPFGFGPRSCVGQRLANLELELLIANVVRNFNMKWNYPDMTWKTTLTYGFADPLRIKMVPIRK